MRVLIADDDPIYRGMVEELLSEWGMQVTTADDGQSAWRAMQNDPEIELAILDWMMPGMQGDEVCQQIKLQGDRDVFVLLITGSRNREEITKVLVAGADDYVLKPFEAIDLKIRVRNAMRTLRLLEEIRALQAAQPTKLTAEAS